MSLARRWGGAGCLLSGTLRAESGREEKEVCEICFSLARKMFRGWQQFFAGSLNCLLLSLTCTVCTGGLGQFRIPDFSEGTACREADTAQPEAIVQLSVVPSAQKLMSTPLHQRQSFQAGEKIWFFVCVRRGTQALPVLWGKKSKKPTTLSVLSRELFYEHKIHSSGEQGNAPEGLFPYAAGFSCCSGCLVVFHSPEFLRGLKRLQCHPLLKAAFGA